MNTFPKSFDDWRNEAMPCLGGCGKYVTHVAYCRDCQIRLKAPPYSSLLRWSRIVAQPDRNWGVE